MWEKGNEKLNKGDGMTRDRREMTGDRPETGAGGNDAGEAGQDLNAGIERPPAAGADRCGNPGSRRGYAGRGR